MGGQQDWAGLAVLPAGTALAQYFQPGRQPQHHAKRLTCATHDWDVVILTYASTAEIWNPASWEQNGLIRVVATRIEWDGTMQRRVVDTAHSGDSPRWEDLAARALVAPPPYRPAAGAPLYHVSLNGGMDVLVAENDLWGPLLDLVTAVMALGEEV